MEMLANSLTLCANPWGRGEWEGGRGEGEWGGGGDYPHVQSA